MPYNTELTQQIIDIAKSIKIVEMNMTASGSQCVIAEELDKEKMDIIGKLMTLLNKTMNSSDKKSSFSVEVKHKSKMICD